MAAAATTVIVGVVVLVVMRPRFGIGRIGRPFRVGPKFTSLQVRKTHIMRVRQGT